MIDVWGVIVMVTIFLACEAFAAMICIFCLVVSGMWMLEYVLKFYKRLQNEKLAL